MRTTLSLDDDVLDAAKALAAQRGRTLGEIVSELARQSLLRPPSGRSRNGVPLLSSKPGDPTVTLELVNALRDELP